MNPPDERKSRLPPGPPPAGGPPPAPAEARLAAILDALPDLLFVLDRDGRIHDYHAPRPDRLYVPPEQFLGRTMAEVLPEPARGIVARAIADAVAHGHHQGSVYPLAAGGETRWFEISMSAQGDLHTAAGRLVAIVRDITARRRAEDALRESSEKYRLLTEGMQDVVWILDIESRRFLYVSPSIEKLRGFTPAEVLAQPLEAAWVPEQRAELEEFTRRSVADFLAGRITDATYVIYEMLQPRKDGSAVPSEIVAHLVRNPQTGRIEAHGVTRDISARRRAETALRDTLALLDATQRFAKIGGWVWDVAEQKMTWAAETYRLHGFAPDEFAAGSPEHIARSLACYDPADRPVIAAAFRRCATHGEPYTLEFPLTTAQGRRIWIQTSAEAVRQGPRIVQVVGHILDITARKQAEQALRESEERLAQLAIQGRTIVWEMDAEGRCTFVSPVVKDVLGYRPEEVVGKLRFFDLFPPECRREFKAAAFEVFRRKAPLVDFENICLTKDGRRVWVTTNGFPLLDADGGLRGYRGSVMDITKRKQAEEALVQSEAKYRQLFTALRDPFATTDLKGRLLEFNQPFQALLGFSKKELLGLSYRDITPRKWHAAEKKIIAEQVRKRGFSTVYEKEYTRKNGTRVPVELRTMLVTDAAGAPVGMSAIIRDISGRKRSELALQQARDELERRVRERTAELEASRAALAKSEAQFRQMADSIQEVFWLLDARTGRALYVSPAFDAIWGRPRRTLLPDFSAWLRTLHPDDRDAVLRDFSRGLATGKFVPLEYRILRPDGSIRWIRDNAWAIRDARGRIIRIAGVFRDITEQRRLEAEILRAGEAEQLRIGHDLHDSLGQSLTGIGYLADAVREELARKALPEAADMRELARLIRTTADQAHDLARGLLPMDLKPRGIVAALQELAVSTQERLGAPCRYTGLAEAPPLPLDVASQLYRIAQEAATNAAKHSRAKRIDIRLDRTPAGLRLTVRDNGAGLPAKNRSVAGLGLDIMRYRAGHIGATLRIASRPGRGTAIHCLLPSPAPKKRKR